MKRPVKLALHHTPGTFSDEWIRWCEARKIPFKLVDCFSTDIIDQMADCDGLMWHWPHTDFAAAKFARQLTMTLEASGKRVFPSTSTSWHYDDKVGQKYLFEALDLPHAKAHVFYRREDAERYVDTAELPLVFKLRRGAGSMNVRLIRSRQEGRRIVARAFGSGWSDMSRTHVLKDRIWSFRRDRTLRAFGDITRGIYRAIRPHPAFRAAPTEVGYAYFQQFVPDNNSDIRVIVIGDRAFAIRRMVRAGDFRASGSGDIRYEPEQIPAECIRAAFRATRKLAAQCVAYDFVFDGPQPLIIEISYAFTAAAYYKCPGFWTEDMKWHAAPVIPQEFIVSTFLTELEDRTPNTPNFEQLDEGAQP